MGFMDDLKESVKQSRREAGNQTPNVLEKADYPFPESEIERFTPTIEKTAPLPQTVVNVSGQKIKNGYCQHCKTDRIVMKPKVNHLLHGLASLILINWWIPWFLIWFAAIFFNALTGYRCSVCGRVV